MLAICEECSKKYNIDESKMKSDRARFACYECGHIIVVAKLPTKNNTERPSVEALSKDA
ncbi:zinc-ribbon domain-containing protein [Desulfogranum marinum]|uniref:zinc-ribbon domain-containing protein n=1 Tax=Desulfogranum marinum TaxID=453220 RepID=UPI00196573F1|nr:zinc-ribbon domain-containing protein [Desulfogranum marinum]MBM9511555.1 zinc-ribbon domain-containing protein [Desulfogranum marinum]